MKERTRKTSQTMQLKKQDKGNGTERGKIKNTNKIKEVKTMTTIIIQINNNLQVLWNSKVKFVSVSQLLGWSVFGCDSGPFTVPGLIASLVGRRGRKEFKKKKPPACFKSTKWVLLVFLAAACWEGLVSIFLLSVVLRWWGPGLGCTLHSCPASSPVPQFAVGPLLPFYTWPMPSVHRLYCPWGEPIRGNSYYPSLSLLS